MDNRITWDEIHGLFGDEMPMEAAELLWSGATLDEKREGIQRLAKRKDAMTFQTMQLATGAWEATERDHPGIRGIGETKQEAIENLGEEIRKLEPKATVGIHPAPEMFTEEELSTDHVLRYFHYAHLPAKLQVISAPFCMLARGIIDSCPRNPERTVALRKLLEAKDAAVRTLVE